MSGSRRRWILVVALGSTVLARETPSNDFRWHIRVPEDALAAANGVIAITTDTIVRPGTRGSADRRELRLRFYEVTIAR